MTVAYGSEQELGKICGEACGRGALCSTVEGEGERVGKKNEAAIE